MSRTNCAIGKDYVPASFKGVQFYCTEADVEGGRRGAEGEFPFGEQTAYADLGRKIRVYHLTAAFREDDHVSDSQALFAACESPGPGMLVHPTRGTVRVACRSVKVKDNIEEAAGETKAELEFVEANDVSFGLGASIFGIISSGLTTASRTTFLANYRPFEVAQPWRRDVIDRAQLMVQLVHNVAHVVLPPDAPLSQRRQIVRMQEIAIDDGLAGVPDNVDKALTVGFNLIADSIVDPFAEFNEMRKLANAATSSTRGMSSAARHSEEAILLHHRITAGVGMADAAMARKYNNVDETLLARDQTLAVLADETRLAYDSCNNELYLELRNYARQFASMMERLAYNLPALVIYNFSGGVHPLIASYAIYDDAKRHRELELRNNVDANGRFSPLVVAGVSP